MSKKKLLITASTFPRWKDDTEPRFILDYANAMTEYYEVHVLVPMAPGAQKEEVMENVYVHRFHYFPIHRLETLCYPGAIVPRIKEKKIRVLLVPFLFLSMYFKMLTIKNKYDYVHSNWIIPQGIIQGLFNNPYIMSGLGGDVSSINKGIMKTLKQNTISKAKYITVVSRDLKDMLVRNYAVSPEKIAVVPLGCDCSKISPANKINNYFNQNGQKVILFVGRLVEKKGLEYLIEAMDGLDAKLVIVGNGPNYEKIKAMVDKSASNIEMVGAQNKEQLKKAYASCDIYCIPSVIAKDGDKDGLPVALIEAMASGAPIVGTRLGGIEEVVVQGENGLLVEQRNSKELHNALLYLLENDVARKSFSQKSREIAMQYDFPSLAMKYKEIIDSSLGRSLA